MRIHDTAYIAITLCTVCLASPAFAQLPPNVRVAPVFRDLVESIADQSPTFRHQLLRIAAEPDLAVRIDIVPRVVGARAMTRMVRQGDTLAAHIEVTRFDDVVELIAHEIEHVIEQLDRVDLEAGAGANETGIHSVAANGTMFETARAASVGVIVAREVRASARRPADGCPAIDHGPTAALSSRLYLAGLVN